MEKAKALINQKDILEDALLEQIFDNGEYLMQPNSGDTPLLHLYVGWINNNPYIAMLQYGTNELSIIPHFPQGDEDKKYIRDILMDENGNTYCEVEFNRVNGCEYYTVQFYFKEDEQ